jgi:tetratricopeptide (TPR) repeat protein
MSAPGSNSRYPWIFLLVLVALATAAVIAYYKWPRSNSISGDAVAANTRGVGRMERYEYGEAEREFTEAARIAPDWTPARVNLGIAIMNQNTPETKGKATEIFREILAKESDNKHAHYCLGILLYDQGKLNEAHEQFVAVNKLDPEDPYTLLRLGSTHPKGKEDPEAIGYFEKALKLNPNLNGARYELAMALRVPDMPRAKQLLDEKEALARAKWEDLSGIKYSEMGKYADVIGRDPSLAGKPVVGPLPMFEPFAGINVKLAEGTRWATAADLDPLRKAARERFGATMVFFDFDRDGDLDVLLLSAVVEKDKVRDLLLRNEGKGSFSDITAAAGLATPRPSLGAAAADYDNDGKIDLVITGVDEQHLFRNKGDGSFEDVSAAAGLDQWKGVCLGCSWLDLDQDGDLDLIVCRYAQSVVAAAGFAPKGPPEGGEVAILENIGEAPPAKVDAPSPPLTTRFKKFDRFALASKIGAASAVLTDFDNDRDVDIIVLVDGQSPMPIENERLMRFKKVSPSWVSDKKGPWNGGLVLDANHDERSDLFLIAADGPPVFLLSKGERDFAPGNTNSPTLKQAVATDIDMDGWPDIVGISGDGKIVLLHNKADGKLEHVPTAFGETSGAIACGVADFDADGLPDLMFLTETGLQLRRNQGNGNRALHIDPTGLRRRGSNLLDLPSPERTNADGIGSWIVAHSGPHWTGAERTTISAGMGQSLMPTSLGIGKNGLSDAVRIRWPDGVIQAELGLAAGPIIRMEEYDRKPSSCPVLLTWDGEKFVFITDILGAGSIGESNPDGSTRPPRPEESIKIEPNQLKPKDGKYIIKLAEPMDEVMYIDRVQLVAVDHPKDMVVFPDERFATADPQPTQEILAFRNRYFPKKATDHRGRDFTQQVQQRDRRAVDGFAKRSWLGYAEDHSVTLDFGDVPAGSGGKWHLVLASWTEYAYPETIYGATRAGVELQFPVLERLASDGKTWELVGDLGFPAGMPRVMTREIPDFKPGQTTYRLRTNMQVYWDQVFLAQAVPGAREAALEPESANLAVRGFVREVYPDGRPPVAYDDSRLEPVSVTRWRGNLTRLGEVNDLLTKTDDRFAICGPGDELMIHFDATRLPPLAEGWTRSFVLRSWGYCKDAALTTQTGGTVEPLPFRAMKNYPDFGGVLPPATDAAKWNTRPAGGR